MVRTVKILTSAMLFSLIFYACGNKNEPFVYKAPVTAYQSIKTIQVENHPDESYEIYVPTHYNEDAVNPLIICFSPNGNGLKPVQNLRFAAETFGFIVAGSNVIRNQNEGNGEAIRNLIYDVQDKYNIDASRMYACGFSGGARLATLLGNQQVVAGVISCGAGPGDYSTSKPYPWYGIVGKSDFNYMEFARFVPQKIQQPFYAVVYTLEGHEWPDSSYLYDAVAFMELHAYKAGTEDPDPAIILGYKTNLLAEADALQTQTRYQEAYGRVNDGIALLSGLTETEDLMHLSENIQQLPGYKLDLSKQAELDKLYAELIKVYPAAIVQKDTTWWKKELNRLDVRIDNASGEAAYTFKRVRSTLGILCYSMSRQLLANKSASVKNVLEVYQLLEPQNPDVFYFKSQYEMQQGNEQKSQEYLQKARELGFSDS